MNLPIPILPYFQRKNDYSGAHKGMRYFFTPGEQTITNEQGEEAKEKILTVFIWPDPWELRRTDPALRQEWVFPLSEQGRADAIALLEKLYVDEQDTWDNCPSILDAEPWYPAPKDEAENT